MIQITLCRIRVSVHLYWFLLCSLKDNICPHVKVAADDGNMHACNNLTNLTWLKLQTHHCFSHVKTVLSKNVICSEIKPLIWHIYWLSFIRQIVKVSLSHVATWQTWNNHQIWSHGIYPWQQKNVEIHIFAHNDTFCCHCDPKSAFSVVTLSFLSPAVSLWTSWTKHVTENSIPPNTKD